MFVSSRPLFEFDYGFLGRDDLRRDYDELSSTFLGFYVVRLRCSHTQQITTIGIMPLFRELATDSAALWIGIFWTGPFIANDRRLLKKCMEATTGIHKFALHDARKAVIHIPNNLNFSVA